LVAARCNIYSNYCTFMVSPNSFDTRRMLFELMKPEWSSSNRSKILLMPA
jgi:hypothetical protein